MPKTLNHCLGIFQTLICQVMLVNFTLPLTRSKISQATFLPVVSENRITIEMIEGFGDNCNTADSASLAPSVGCEEI